jgi:hypothetical protein
MLTDAIQLVETKGAALGTADAGVASTKDAEAAAAKKLAAAVDSRQAAEVVDQGAVDEWNTALEALAAEALAAKRGPVLPPVGSVTTEPVAIRG